MIATHPPKTADISNRAPNSLPVSWAMSVVESLNQSNIGRAPASRSERLHAKPILRYPPRRQLHRLHRRLEQRRHWTAIFEFAHDLVGQNLFPPRGHFERPCVDQSAVDLAVERQSNRPFGACSEIRRPLVFDQTRRPQFIPPQ